MAKHHRFLLFYGERSANNYYPQATTTALTASSARTIRSQATTALLAAISERTTTAHHLWRPANPVLSDLRTG